MSDRVPDTRQWCNEAGQYSNPGTQLKDFNCTSRKSGNGIGFLTLPKFTLLSITFEAINIGFIYYRKNSLYRNYSILDKKMVGNPLLESSQPLYD